jgi:hypothetical protein
MYQEQKTLEEQVNTKGTKLWVKMNDNSKSEKMRALFVQQNGGFFLKEGMYWVWKSPVEEKNGYWLKRVDTGQKTFFLNMSEFGRQNGLTTVKICELLNGKRKTYKGWTAVEIRPVKETEGAAKKEKKKKKKKIQITMSAIFVDQTTNEIIKIPSIAEFARQNNLDYANLRKLALGKSKSYKNLKLYNPLEPYNGSAEG